MNGIVSCWPVNDFVRFHRYVCLYLNSIAAETLDLSPLTCIYVAKDLPPRICSLVSNG